MRQIKFRAWDTEKKEMAEVTHIGFLDNEITLMDSECRVWTTVQYYIAIPMQYTGLHDKNDREIYEGDIFILSDPKHKHIVEWSDNGFMGKQNGTLGSYIGLSYWNDDIEVIGNVYENPELLQF